MTWQQIPFIRFLIPFLLGIGLYSWCGTLALSWWVLIGVYSLIFAALILLQLKSDPSISIVRTWGMVLFMAEKIYTP